MKIVIIGSGPSAVAAAVALTKSNHEVVMLDFGNEMEDESRELARKLKISPITKIELNYLKKGFQHKNSQDISTEQKFLSSFFKQILASKFSSAEDKKKQFGSLFVYKDTENYLKLTKESPQFYKSLAKGGLSNVWGAACYPLSEIDYQEWPIPQHEMFPHYQVINELLTIGEKKDVLEAIYPAYTLKEQENEIRLNPQSLSLLNKWTQNKEKLTQNGFTFGQSRLAVLTDDYNERNGCQYCGLCLYGCPYNSIYNSAFTVDELINNHSNFRYQPGFFLRQFQELSNGKISLELENIKNKKIQFLECDKLFLGAGAISSLRIVADSLKIYPKNLPILDNDLLLLPLVKSTAWQNFSDNVEFTLSQLVLSLNNPAICDHNIHIQFYAYSDYIFDRFSPLVNIWPSFIKKRIQNLMFNTFITFIYLHSEDSTKMMAEIIQSKNNDAIGIINIKYQENPAKKKIIHNMMKTISSNRKLLDLFPIKMGLKVMLPGSSNHIAGTLPMKANPKIFETHVNGLLYGTKSVYIVDQAVFPFLPAQNLTYTAMANAHRVANLFIESNR